MSKKCNKNTWLPTLLLIYKLLNHISNDLDPSKIFELYGYKGIIEHLKKAEKKWNISNIKKPKI